jgi:Zn-dependent protease with chaperone function
MENRPMYSGPSATTQPSHNQKLNHQTNRIFVKRWPGETTLYVFVLTTSLIIWFFLIISVIGLIYAMVMAIFLFFSQLSFFAYLRGTAIRVGENQFPELYARCKELAELTGLKKTPEIYITQADGALNAFATRFFRTQIVVLYSELLDSCGQNEAARDMIIGHELGHIKAGHLNLLWLELFGMWVPFLGSAYSRAREYTCDRYGAALCGNLKDGIYGLTLLAAGPKLAPKVNLNAFVDQRSDVSSALMTIGRWLSGYPTLSERLYAINPELGSKSVSMLQGRLKAWMFIFTITISLFVASVVFWQEVSSWAETFFEDLETTAFEENGETDKVANLDKDHSAFQILIDKDFESLKALIAEVKEQSGSIPVNDSNALSIFWQTYRGEDPYPSDPYDGYGYGYEHTENGYRLWSVGPDGESQTSDDIEMYVLIDIP